MPRPKIFSVNEDVEDPRGVRECFTPLRVGTFHKSVTYNPGFAEVVENTEDQIKVLVTYTRRYP